MTYLINGRKEFDALASNWINDEENITQSIAKVFWLMINTKTVSIIRNFSKER